VWKEIDRHWEVSLLVQCLLCKHEDHCKRKEGGAGEGKAEGERERQTGRERETETERERKRERERERARTVIPVLRRLRHSDLWRFIAKLLSSKLMRYPASQKKVDGVRNDS